MQNKFRNILYHLYSPIPFISFIPFIPFLFACEMIVDVDLPPYDSQLVANCFFNPDTLFEVHVSHSLGILDTGTLDNIENAKVEILENGQVISVLSHTGGGIYSSTGVYPSAGQPYSLKVEASGYESIGALDAVPLAIPIISVTLKDSVYVGELDGTYAETTIKFNDPVSADNFYAIEIWQYDSIDGYRYTISLSTIDPSVANEQYSSRILFSDIIFDGKTYDLKVYFDSYILTQNRKLYVRLNSISKAYYLYNKSLRLHRQNQGNPFAEPVQVYGNIENGLGIFAGYSYDEVLVK
ncbi:MAG: DUF4249 domain-containing protein [Cytophagales bacterium]|nr:DUF4249 domain-containing protein [Cytophagales bacterium]